MSAYEHSDLDVLLSLAGVEVDEAERERLGVAYQHYRVGLDVMNRMELPAEVRPYLVADIDHGDPA